MASTVQIVLDAKDLASKPIGNVNQSLQNVDKSAGLASKGLGAMSTMLTGTVAVAATAAIAGMAALGASLAAVVKTSLDVEAQFDKASDAIIIGTGASGAALKAMESITRELKTSTAGLGVTYEDVGKVVAELNTRTGATGDTLKSLSDDTLQFSRLTGVDAVEAARLATRTMGDWGLSIDEGSMLLDRIFGASQAFGIGVDSLMQKVVQFGAPMRQMGFDLDTSIALLGKWEREGVNTELVLGSLRIAVNKFAAANIPLKEGLIGVINEIKSYRSDSMAAAKASEYFGARAGPDMAAAIREGRFELEDALIALQNTTGGLEDAAERTLDWRDKWAIAMAKIQDKFVPVGQIFGNMIERLLPSITGAMDRFASVVADLSTYLFSVYEDGSSLYDGVLSQFPSWLQPIIKATGLWISSIRNLITDLSAGRNQLNAWNWMVEETGNVVNTVFRFIVQTVKDRLPEWATSLQGWATKAAEWAGALWSGWVWPKLQEFWGELTSWITDPEKRQQLTTKLAEWASKFQEWAGEIWATYVQPKIDEFGTNLSKWIDENIPEFGDWLDSVKEFWNDLQTFWDEHGAEWVTSLQNFYTETKEKLDALWSTWVEIFGDGSGQQGNIRLSATAMMQFLGTFAQGVGNVFQGFLDAFQSFSDAILYLKRAVEDLRSGNIIGAVDNLAGAVAMALRAGWDISIGGQIQRTIADLNASATTAAQPTPATPTGGTPAPTGGTAPSTVPAASNQAHALEQRLRNAVNAGAISWDAFDQWVAYITAGNFTPVDSFLRMKGYARGGRAMTGGSYWVGEHGPELFTPDQNGQIAPSWASQMMSKQQQGNTYNVYVQSTGSDIRDIFGTTQLLSALYG